MKEENKTSQSVLTKQFWMKNLVLIPGICSLLGIGITILIQPARYNINYALLALAMLAVILLSRKIKIAYKIHCYLFAAMSPLMFLLICTFRLTFKAPFLLSVSDWVNVILIWSVIFISSLVLDHASNKLSDKL